LRSPRRTPARLRLDRLDLDAELRSRLGELLIDRGKSREVRSFCQSTKNRSTSLAQSLRQSLRLARAKRRWHRRRSQRSEEGEAAMIEKSTQARKTSKQATTLEHGINLEVAGRAIIAQADERIRWHKRTAGVMEAELKAMTMKPGAPASIAEDWKQVSRRTDLQSKIDGHLEYARFLDFVRRNIIRNRRYRLALTDMTTLEIMPKGRYW
jgi:hypothetical protein